MAFEISRERRTRRRPGVRRVEVVQDVADDLPLVGVVHDREVARDADLLAVAAQHAHAHRVKRADPQVARGVADHAFQARLHLAGGLVGEGHRQDAIREDLLLFEQIGDAVGQHARLPGPAPAKIRHGPSVCSTAAFERR